MFPQAGLGTQTVFHANSTANDSAWHTWKKINGSSHVVIFALAGGGGGGNGVVGAAGASAGGGGGGSSGLAYVAMPASLLPEVLYISVGVGGASNTAGIRTSISVVPDPATDILRVLTVTPGGAGGNGSGLTPGIAGTGGVMVTNLNLYSRTGYQKLTNGAAGVAGGTTSSGGAGSYPITGLRGCGGTGGAGLPASGSGAVGGAISANGLWPTVSAGGQGGTSATTPPTDGLNGIVVNPFFALPGQGGGSTHSAATGAGLVAGNGGNGAYGSGGGGGGAGLTGSTQGLGGKGGDGYVVIIEW